MVNTLCYKQLVLSEPNYAGNIIINLASLPDFLRKPILKKRMTEFFSMSEPDKSEIINNALEAAVPIGVGVAAKGIVQNPHVRDFLKRKVKDLISVPLLPNEIGEV